MIAEPILIITAWFKHVTNGINAEIATMDSADLFGAYDAPPDIVFIGNRIEDALVARWKEPLESPALYITIDAPSVWDGEVHQVHRNSDRVTVALRYIVKNADSAEAILWTAHTLRAIVRTAKRLNADANKDSRKLNGIFLPKCEDILLTEWNEAIGSHTATGAAILSYHVSDQNP